MKIGPELENHSIGTVCIFCYSLIEVKLQVRKSDQNLFQKHG